MAKKNQRQDAGGSRGMVRALLAGAVGLVTLSVGGMAFYMLVSQYQREIEEAKRPEDTVMVIVAARDLYQGVTVNEEDLYAVAIPPKYLPPDTFLAPEHVMGRVPRERILANEFIRAERLADPDNGQGVHALIPRGFRAISVEVSDGEALAGFLQPGNYVDVLNTLEPEEEGNEPITNTLLQAIFVLGVNGISQREESPTEGPNNKPQKRPSVTLMVSQTEAEKVAYAETLGDIRLTLRNDLDLDTTDNTDGVDIQSLRKKLAKPVIKRSTVRQTAAPAGNQIKIIQGGEVTETRTVNGELVGP